jgi:flagellar biosynthesis protein FlhF
MKSRRNTGVVRVYEGQSIFEAYSKLKRELGDKAVILSTKHLKKGGFLGFGGSKIVQITATDNVKMAPRRNGGMTSKSNQQIQNSSPAQSQSSLSPPYNTAVAEMPQTAAATFKNQENGHGETNYDGFKKELNEIRKMISEIQTSGQFQHWPDLPPEFQKAYEKLQSYNINTDIARALVHRWKNHYPNFKKGDRVDIKLLQNYISEMLVPAGPIRVSRKKACVTMLVGPTGVGKTTTLAKLAARYKIQEDCSVALITFDTYRIAAVEQLRTYADLIGVPLKVVNNPEELKEAIKSFSDRDLILVDSAGRSPKNEAKMRELKEMVDAASPDELHLVLSMSVQNDVMKDTLERYADFHVHKLLLTKLDECVHYGIILSIISRTQKPIGYLTVGQEVPDDIELATSETLSRLVLNLQQSRV